MQPVLVLPVYRGGAKFRRALDSLRGCEDRFRRIVVSLNGPEGSADRAAFDEYRQSSRTKAEAIVTGEELPWMAHQYFWLAHLEATGEQPSDWVLWFAHDDQLRKRGIDALVDDAGEWPMESGTIYLGPWGMRYDPPGGMYDGPADAPLESWTSFPVDGPLRLPVAEWIAQQLEQPTYINMSGTITQLASFQALRRFPVPKPGGMRIEMATAAAPGNRFAQELDEPIVITHVSPTTDRTTYAKVARRDDLHMAAWLANYVVRNPGAGARTSRAGLNVVRSYWGAARGRGLPREDWRQRAVVPA